MTFSTPIWVVINFCCTYRSKHTNLYALNSKRPPPLAGGAAIYRARQKKAALSFWWRDSCLLKFPAKTLTLLNYLGRHIYCARNGAGTSFWLTVSKMRWQPCETFKINIVPYPKGISRWYRGTHRIKPWSNIGICQVSPIYCCFWGVCSTKLDTFFWKFSVNA